MQKPQYIEVKIVPPVRSFYLAMLLEEIGTIRLRPSLNKQLGALHLLDCIE